MPLTADAQHEYKQRLLRIPYYSYLSVWFSLTSRRPIGTNVYDRDWDVLVILDTCRVDALETVAPEFDFFDADDVDHITSVGSGSQEWIANTFTEAYRDDVADTAYISANGYSQLMLARGEEFPTDRLAVDAADWQTLTADDLEFLHDVWDSSPEPEREGYMDPQVPTDRAVSTKRTRDPGRLVVHYSRPHDPYARRAIDEGRELEPHESSPFQTLARGDVDRDTVWELYLDELRYGLRQVETLLRSVDGTVVVTADHGEAFGEWGVYRHPFLPHPKLRCVPWLELQAEDTGEYEPTYHIDDVEEDSESEATTEDLHERLKHLGYAE